jgi:hypothetical protein
MSVKPIQPVTNMHVAFLQSSRIKVKSVDDASRFVAAMSLDEQVAFFLDEKRWEANPVADTEQPEVKKLDEKPEVDVAPAKADPAPLTKVIKRMCAGCGAFIENVVVAFTGPGMVHGQCEKCAKEFYRSGPSAA